MISHRDTRSVLRRALCAVSVSVACAGSIAQSPESLTVARGISGDVVGAPTLGRREMAEFAGRPLADALNRLRPDWLRTNASARGSDEGSRAVVYVNDVASGELRALQMIPAAAAVEVQFLSASAAQMRYGPACRCPAGVIRVQTRSLE